MSKRDFGTTKCLLHFDFPYFNEPNDGLDDDVGIETWSKENSTVRLIGTQIPSVNHDNVAPKFGYRCFDVGKGAVIGTNTSGIWNLNSSKDYEIEFFVYPTAHSSSTSRYLFRLCSSGSTSVFTVAWNASGYITVLCPKWGITSAVTSSTAPTASTWHHILLRISNNTLKLYINGTQRLTQALTPDVTLSVDNARIGYNASSNQNYAYYYIIDEFVFRHSAGKYAPTVPKRPYSGKLKLDTVGGYEGVGDVSTTGIDVSSTNRQVNKYGIISAITDAKTFTVSSWNGSGVTAEAGSELMIHITAPRSTSSAAYPLVGLYAFAKIESVDGTNVVLSRDITTANGYDFTLSSSLLSTYYVQAITVPRYTSVILNSAGSFTPLTWSTTTGGGIVAFRTSGKCTINGKILTHGKGAVRYDLQQVTNSKLIDRFLCSQGGGVFISCGGTLTIGSSARLGASWSGAGDGSNGAAGKGGNGGGSPKASGGAGGVGGGGGGASQYSISNYADGGACGSNGNNKYLGSGGGGCGGVGGAGTLTTNGAGGGGGGGQGGSGGAGGTGVKAAGNNGTINGGDYGYSSSLYPSGAGGGGAGGNGGRGKKSGSNIAELNPGQAGASIILIAKTLKAEAAALSTGGSAGTYGNQNNTGGSGGGGTGFCYIACEGQAS